MAKQKMAALVVGNWVGDTFKANVTQPSEPISDVAKMLAWTKRTFGEIGGTFEYIRKVPGALTLSFSRRVTAKFGGAEQLVEAAG